MSPQSRLSIARPDIAKLFDASTSRVYSRADIEQILSQNRAFWRLSAATTTGKFIDYFVSRGDLQAIRFEFAYRPTVRYVWGDAPELEIVQSIKPEGYFTHYTAMRLHGLTEQIPKTVYLNFEQDLTGGGGELTQTGIDRAFRSKPRVSSNIAPFGDFQICLLNGRKTDRLGVIELADSDNGHIWTTGIERTLIDITVRPIYAGGAFEVLRAYQLASKSVSINKLSAYLKQLDYTYPYHQAIGFYLQRSGAYKQSQLDLLRRFPIEFNFYLANQMGKTQLDQEWRLFVPEGF